MLAPDESALAKSLAVSELRFVPARLKSNVSVDPTPMPSCGLPPPWNAPPVEAPKSKYPNGMALMPLLVRPSTLKLLPNVEPAVTLEIAPPGLFRTKAVRKPPLLDGLVFVNVMSSVAEVELAAE